MSKARDLANAADVLDDVSATELSYVNGVTSAIQTQLNAKQAVVSGVDDTEIGYLNGVTSAIQTQIDSKIGQATAINPTIVDAKGDIIAATAADTVARLAVGTNDTVLTADSSTATGLKWATPAAGGMTVLASGTLSGSEVSLTSINQNYNHLQLVIRKLDPDTDGQNFRVRFNGGSSGYIAGDTNTNSNNNFSDTFISGVGQDNGTSYAAIIVDCYDYAFAGNWKVGRILSVMNNPTTSSNGNFQMWGWAWNTGGSLSAISSMQLSMTSGDFSGGTYILYGVK